MYDGFVESEKPKVQIHDIRLDRRWRGECTVYASVTNDSDNIYLREDIRFQMLFFDESGRFLTTTIQNLLDATLIPNATYKWWSLTTPEKPNITPETLGRAKVRVTGNCHLAE